MASIEEPGQVPKRGADRRLGAASRAPSAGTSRPRDLEGRLVHAELHRPVQRGPGQAAFHRRVRNRRVGVGLGVRGRLPAFLHFLYKSYWRVEITGIENVPMEGRALLVANHSGQLPWDGMMVGTAVLTEHPAQRLVRTLYAPSCPGSRGFHPAGASGPNPGHRGKRDPTAGTGRTGRRLSRRATRGRASRTKTATGWPALGGGALSRWRSTPRRPSSPCRWWALRRPTSRWPSCLPSAGITGIPYLPITLSVSLAGSAGGGPLPTKWYIDFGEPIPMDD